MHSQHGIHVLGIESSCDDTGVAIVNQDGKILSNCIHSQLKQHLSHGGIIPTVAKEYHLENIDRVAKQAFEQSGLVSVKRDIDAIAVSTRPGLQFSLQVGLNYARTLAKKYSKPLIPIHHMQAHALMPLLENKSIRFPYLALLLSGGHCLLAIAKRYNEFHILGSTRDEAPGDILDKFARRCKLKNLGPPYDGISGGASIELLSRRDGANRFKYFNTDGAIPMFNVSSCDFSFTGYRGSLDAAIPLIDSLWLSGDREQLLDSLSHLCSSLQRAILIQVAKKLQRALMFYRMHWRYKNEDVFGNRDNNGQHIGFNLQSIKNDDETGAIDVAVSGGVAANNYLVDGIRLACKENFDPKIETYAPTRDLCSDNGLMVAWNGMLRYKDFLESKRNLSSRNNGDFDLDNSIICDEKQMDLVQISAQCPVGLDLSDQVKLANFSVFKLRHPEFRLATKA